MTDPHASVELSQWFAWQAQQRESDLNYQQWQREMDRSIQYQAMIGPALIPIPAHVNVNDAVRHFQIGDESVPFVSVAAGMSAALKDADEKAARQWRLDMLKLQSQANMADLNSQIRQSKIDRDAKVELTPVEHTCQTKADYIAEQVAHDRANDPPHLYWKNRKDLEK